MKINHAKTKYVVGVDDGVHLDFVEGRLGAAAPEAFEIIYQEGKTEHVVLVPCINNKYYGIRRIKGHPGVLVRRGQLICDLGDSEINIPETLVSSFYETNVLADAFRQLKTPNKMEWWKWLLIVSAVAAVLLVYSVKTTVDRLQEQYYRDQQEKQTQQTVEPPATTTIIRPTYTAPVVITQEPATTTFVVVE